MILKTLDIDFLKKKALNKDRRPNGHLKNTTVRAIKILAILERDNFQCVQCLAKDKLTIDHINGREFAKHNNAYKYKLEECQTLCMACHIKKNLKVRK